MISHPPPSPSSQDFSVTLTAPTLSSVCFRHRTSSCFLNMHVTWCSLCLECPFSRRPLTSLGSKLTSVGFLLWPLYLFPTYPQDFFFFFGQQLLYYQIYFLSYKSSQGHLFIIGRLHLFIFFIYFTHFPQQSPLWQQPICSVSAQFSSVTQSCPTLYDPMDWSMPGHPVPQTHVHWVCDAIQPSHPLSSPSPPFSLS